MFDIFISHSSLDKSKFVEPLAHELRKMGLQVWYDKYSTRKGDKIKDSIIEGINESLIFVAIISRNYYESNWANLELGILQSSHSENLLPIIFPDIKNWTGQKYPFLLDYNYIETKKSIKEVARELYKIVIEKKQNRGLWYIEKTNLNSLIKEMRSYCNFQLDQVAIHLSKVTSTMHTNYYLLLNEIKVIIDMLLTDVANFENIFIESSNLAIEIFLKMDFLSQNIKEHLKYLHKLFQDSLHNFGNKISSQEEMYLIQFSLYSIIEWYMITYFKKPIFKKKNIIAVFPEDFTREDIIESYNIETLVLPPKLIASLSTDIDWYNYNPLTLIGARDADSGKLIGFFNTLPISDRLYTQIRSGSFDDTNISIKDIRQYDIPGFYKLYLCSFCIHPSYNTTNAFKIIYTTFIDFLLNLASECDIYISNIIADGVTPKGASLCETIGMTQIAKSIHNSNVYEANLIPPEYTTIKLSNKIGHKLIAYYERKYNEYKEFF